MTFPLWPLLATMAMQTLATMAAYTVPALAPEIARDLGVDGAWAGYFISVVYGIGIVSSLKAARLIHRHGAVRVSQLILLGTCAMLLISALGGLAALVLGAMALGFGYGASAPVSTHLLVPRTAPTILNLVLSLRQIGVPLGGVLAGLLMPPLTLAASWQVALLVQVVPVLVLLAILEALRRRWDAPGIAAAPRRTGLLAPLRLLRGNGALQRLCFAAFVYSGLQLCFIVFMTTHLTTVVGFDLVAAGRALAVYQLSGVIARPIWGWLADHVLAARILLALQGFIMCAAASMAGAFSAAWPPYLILLVCVMGGATASGFTGIAYGEYARIGGAQRTEATGLGSAFMFAGVMVIPLVMSGAVLSLGGYTRAYLVVGVLALLAGLLLAVQRTARATD